MKEVKKIRLELPVKWEGESIWAKITDSESVSELFVDKELTQVLPPQNEKIYFEVEIPQEIHLETIEILHPGLANPVEKLLIKWMQETPITGLKAVHTVIGNKYYEVKTVSETPDWRDWKNYIGPEGEGYGLDLVRWGLVIYETHEANIGRFYFADSSLRRKMHVTVM